MLTLVLLSLSQVPNPAGDTLLNFLEPAYRDQLRLCNIPDINGTKNSAIPGVIRHKGGNPLGRYVSAVWNGTASLDAIFSVLFLTDNPQAELYANLSKLPINQRGIGLKVGIMPVARDRSSISRTDTCTTTIGASVGANAEGSFGFGSAELKTSLAASDDTKSTLTFISGSFISPLAHSLHSTEQSERLNVATKLWRYYEIFPELQTKSLHYLATFDGALLYVGAQTKSLTSFDLASRANIKAGVAGSSTEVNLSYSVGGATEVREFSVFIDKDSREKTWPLVAQFQRLPSVAELSDMSFLASVESSRAEVKPGTSYEHFVILNGIESDLCALSNFSVSKESGVTLVRKMPMRDACVLEAVFDVPTNADPAGTINLAYDINFGSLLNKGRLKVRVNQSGLKVAEDRVVTVPRYPFEGASANGIFQWLVPYFLIDSQRSYDSNQGIDVSIESMVCASPDLKKENLRVRHDLARSQQSAGVFIVSWDVDSGAQFARETIECDVTLKTRIELNSGKAPTRNNRVRLQVPRLLKAPAPP